MEEDTDDDGRDAEPARRVVRRVVRRTPVAPPPPRAAAVAPAPAPAPGPPEERRPDPARLPDPDRPAHRARPVRSLVPRLSWPGVRATQERAEEHAEEPAAQPARTVARPDEALPVEPAPDEPSAHRSVAAGVRERLATLVAATRTTVGERAAALPLPAAAAIVGAVTGLVAALVCWSATLVFAAVLGTPAGGRWGFAVLVLVAVGAVVAARRALDALGAPDPTATSLLGVLLVPVVVLAVFLGPSTTAWAFLIVPVVAALAFAAAQPAVARLSATPQER